MRFTVMYLLLLSAVMVDPVNGGFAVRNELQKKPRPDGVRRSDPKTDHLAQRQQIARNPDPAPGSVHRTSNRLDFAGKHKDGAWFLGSQHKPKTKEKGKTKEAAAAGRKWSFGRVPWW